MIECDPEAEVLARWRYTPDEWRVFTENERGTHEFEVGDTITKNLPLIVIGGAISVVMGVLAGGLSGLIVVMVLVVGFLVIVTAIHQLMRKVTQQRLEAENGEVWIMPDGVCTNGMWFGWAARDPNWRLRIVRRKTIYSNAGNGLEILEFKCLGSVLIRGTRTTIDKEWRVPVPRGKESEADAIVTRILSTQHVDTEDHNSLSLSQGIDPGLQGHEFVGDVCGKCGSTVEAVTAFKWACRD
jgi:hypothetical protein